MLNNRYSFFYAYFFSKASRFSIGPSTFINKLKNKCSTHAPEQINKQKNPGNKQNTYNTITDATLVLFEEDDLFPSSEESGSMT